MSNSSFSMDDYDNISNYRVTQAAHGFAKGDVLRTAGANTYAKAQADSDANAEVVGMVSEVIDANTFRLRVIGRQAGLSGLVADTVYFLSHVTPGTLTTTDPATLSSGFVSKPVLLTDSTTSGVILTYRGINDGGGGDAGPVTLDGISDVTITSPSNGEILTYNSVSGDWENAAAAGGGGGAWTLISTATPSASHPIEFTGLNSTYYAYRLVFDNCTVSTDAQLLYLRTSSDNGSNYDGGASDYQYMIETRNSANTEANALSTGNASIIMHGGTIGNGTNETFGGEIIIMNPSDTSYTKIFFRMHFNASNAGEISYVRGVGERKSTTAVNAFSINAFSGTFSGTLKLYGLSAT